MPDTAKQPQARPWTPHTPAAIMANNATSPYLTSGSDIDISYSPTITWQDTTSAATYTSMSSVLDHDQGLRDVWLKGS